MVLCGRDVYVSSVTIRMLGTRRAVLLSAQACRMNTLLTCQDVNKSRDVIRSGSKSTGKGGGKPHMRRLPIHHSSSKKKSINNTYLVNQSRWCSVRQSRSLFQIANRNARFAHPLNYRITARTETFSRGGCWLWGGW